jgi:hypothetical protein
MQEVKCPNCNTVLEVRSTVEKVICKKCLLNLGKQFIMVETEYSSKYKNLGDGFFERQ